MLKTLIEKEFKAVLLSPRFLGIFAVASVLILLSISSTDAVTMVRRSHRTRPPAASASSSVTAAGGWRTSTPG